MRLTEAELSVMKVLWSGDSFALGEITNALQEVNGWNRNTVHTYLTRMEKKSLVSIDHEDAKPYRAILSQETYAKQERQELLSNLYDGAAGDLIVAFLKESKISQQEVTKLRKMLDEMEV